MSKRSPNVHFTSHLQFGSYRSLLTFLPYSTLELLQIEQSALQVYEIDTKINYLLHYYARPVMYIEI